MSTFNLILPNDQIKINSLYLPYRRFVKLKFLISHIKRFNKNQRKNVIIHMKNENKINTCEIIIFCLYSYHFYHLSFDIYRKKKKNLFVMKRKIEFIFALQINNALLKLW